MRDSAYEAVIAVADDFADIAERYTGYRRRAQLREGLGAILGRLDTSPSADMAARAVIALAEAWLAVIEIEEQDADDGDDDDD